MMNYFLQANALYGSIKHTRFPQISVSQVPLHPPCMFANVDHTYKLAIVMAFSQQPSVMSKLNRQKWRPYKVHE